MRIGGRGGGESLEYGSVRYGRAVCMELLAENQQSPDSSLCSGLLQIERERGRLGGAVQGGGCVNLRGSAWR